MKVHFESYREESAGSFVVDVTIRGERRTVAASGPLGKSFYVFGLAVRFKTGTKIWPGRALCWIESHNVSDLRPCIEKRGGVALAGFLADYKGKESYSQHAASVGRKPATRQP